MQNNPLSFTDPSGYFLSGLLKAIGHAIGAIFRGIVHAVKAVLSSSILRSVLQIAACAFGGPVGCAVAAGAITLATGGTPLMALQAFAFSFVSAGVWGGSEVLGLGSSFGEFSNGVGGLLNGADAITKILVHGTVNGALTLSQGGDFLQGFVTGALGKAGGILALESPLGTISGTEGVLLRTAVAATGGGVGSVLTGGKFANGATSAAFAHLFNAEREKAQVSA